MTALRTSYDEFPYQSVPLRQTHPDHLAERHNGRHLLCHFGHLLKWIHGHRLISRPEPVLTKSTRSGTAKSSLRRSLKRDLGVVLSDRR